MECGYQSGCGGCGVPQPSTGPAYIGSDPQNAYSSASCGGAYSNGHRPEEEW